MTRYDEVNTHELDLILYVDILLLTGRELFRELLPLIATWELHTTHTGYWV